MMLCYARKLEDEKDRILLLDYEGQVCEFYKGKGCKRKQDGENIDGINCWKDERGRQVCATYVPKKYSNKNGENGNETNSN